MRLKVHQIHFVGLMLMVLFKLLNQLETEISPFPLYSTPEAPASSFCCFLEIFLMSTDAIVWCQGRIDHFDVGGV